MCGLVINVAVMELIHALCMIFPVYFFLDYFFCGHPLQSVMCCDIKIPFLATSHAVHQG